MHGCLHTPLGVTRRIYTAGFAWSSMESKTGQTTCAPRIGQEPARGNRKPRESSAALVSRKMFVPMDRQGSLFGDSGQMVHPWAGIQLSFAFGLYMVTKVFSTSSHLICYQ